MLGTQEYAKTSLVLLWLYPEQSRQFWSRSGFIQTAEPRLLQREASRQGQWRCVGLLLCFRYYGAPCQWTHCHVWGTKIILGQLSVWNFTTWWNSTRTTVFGTKVWKNKWYTECIVFLLRVVVIPNSMINIHPMCILRSYRQRERGKVGRRWVEGIEFYPRYFFLHKRLGQLSKN